MSDRIKLVIKHQNGREENQGFWLPGQCWEIKPEIGTRIAKVIIREVDGEREVQIYTEAPISDEVIMKCETKRSLTDKIFRR